MTKKNLQYDFSATYGGVAFDEDQRQKKADKVLSILNDAVGRLEEKLLLDVGCSTGYMTKQYAKKFRYTFGTDIDLPAVRHANTEHGEAVSWLISDSQSLPIANESVDVVTCTHIYEHVPDAGRLVDEIHRVLKPDGVCFFSAGNRFSLVEPHYQLPLLSVMPKPLAHLYLRLLKRGDHYYESHLSYRGLKRLVRRFCIDDYTSRVVRYPERFYADDMIKPDSRKQRAALGVLGIAYWLCPTYLWVLRKPRP